MTAVTVSAWSSLGSAEVSVEQHESLVAHVIWRRPPNNYFDAVLLAKVADVLEQLTDTDCRAVVLRSEGKHFCAGADFRTSYRESGLEADGGHIYDHALRIFRAPLPLVAAVQGAAAGGGLGLAMVADFRIGADRTRFAANFARIGVSQGFGLSVTLPRVLGAQQALGMLLTGRRVTGAEALRLGLLDQLVAEEELEPAAQRCAAVLASGAPLAVREIRRAQRDPLTEQFAAALAGERVAQERLMLTRDFREGVDADRHRRDPDFVGS
jgi:2-(1,2-epoxy-1,2-dihydrophenyl)acetyl-CoA isomerase